jgi:cyanophycin synthetase
MAGFLSKNKDAANILLKRFGLPVPDYILVSSMSEKAVDFLNKYKKVAVKPFDTNRSIGITLGIEKEEELEHAIRTASSYSEKVIIQKYIEGFDYRVLVIDGKVVGVLEHQPGFIVGDSYSTIEQLINKLNEDPFRRNNAGEFKPLKKISLDSNSLLFTLEKQSKTLQDIPVKGEQIQLSLSGNVLNGGISIDRTDDICTVNAVIAVEAAKALNIDVAGIDIRCKDISVPINNRYEGILEINVLPDMVDHVLPFRGKSRDVIGAYLQYLFKE